MTDLPLSLTQRYFLGVIAEEGFDPTWQHVCIAIETGRDLDPARVAEVVQRLEDRHALLATRLAYSDGQPRLAHCPGTGRACEILDLRDGTDTEVRLRVAQRVDAPFDLLSGPLWRLILARGPRGRSVLTFVCHHLIGDGISTWILLKDFGLMYFGGELDPASAPYAEFVRAEQEMLGGPAIEQRMQYWTSALGDCRPLLDLDQRPRRGELGKAATLPLAFEEGTGAALMSNARARRVTPLAMLSAGALSAVKRASGLQDVLSAVVTDLRGAGFSRTVGAFSDLMFVRDPAPGDRDEGQRLVALRNAFFNGWKWHVPVAYLREHLDCFAGGGTTAVNPCDVYLNFIPVKSSSDWWNMIAPYGDESLDFYILGERMQSPTRRMLGPLFFFSFVHARDLSGGVVVHRHAQLEALNQAVVQEMVSSASEMVAPVPA